MIKLTMPDGKVVHCSKGSNLFHLSEQYQKKYSSPIVAGIFNGSEVSLQECLITDGKVDFIEVDSKDGMHTYLRTLFFVFLTAAHKCFPNYRLESRNTLGSALYCIVNNGYKLSQNDLDILSTCMREMIVKESLIEQHFISKDEVSEFLRDYIDEDGMEMLKRLPGEKTDYYQLEGFRAHFYGPIYPNASLVKHFELLQYQEGVVINYPQAGSYEVLQHFVSSRALNKTYQEAEEWSAMLGCNTVAKLDKIIKQGDADELINVAEAYLNKRVSHLADKISQRIDVLKLILIAGPSSSGKTSLAQKLSIQLMVNGVKPLPLSMDDYYLNRCDTPRKPDGSYDFECVEAIDIALFNEHLQTLLHGGTVELPKYNFREGRREYRGQMMRMTDKSILIVEGIHGLNEKLTATLSSEKKLRVYCSALTPMSLDNYNRIPTSDVRLLRRIVRDSRFRSHDVVDTLHLWSSVRAGEEKNIFPFQKNADTIFNTTLIYELAVLKEFAEPLLQNVVQSDGRPYLIAQRLLKLLELVEPLDLDAIPNNSIMREFIGGSIFKVFR